MSRFPKPRCLDFDQPIYDPDEINHLKNILDHKAGEKEEEPTISTASSNVLPSSNALFVSSTLLMPGTPEKDGPMEKLNISQSPPENPPESPPKSPCERPQSSSLSTSVGNLDEKPNDEEMWESSSTSGSSTDIECITDDLLGQQVTDLVHALIRKYQLKEPVTKEEMLQVVTEKYTNWFPMIFEKASSCLEMFFGIDVRETDANDHTYVLANSLGLTYEAELSDEHSMPPNGFLIMILGVIIIEGNYALEEDIWDFLRMIQVYEGKEHFIYGDPSKLIQDMVEENYLEYRQIPSSDPPCHVFLWGPRAKAETTKMKVLQFVAKIKGTDPSFFSDSYKEALREEEERAQATATSVDNTFASQCPVASPNARE